MIDVLHATAVAPAAVAACCTIAEGRLQRAATCAAALMVAATVLFAFAPGARAMVAGSAVSWASAVLAAVALRRGGAAPWIREMARHRVLGAVAMAIMTLAMAIRHTDAVARASVPIGHASAAHVHVASDSWLSSLALAVALALAAAFCVFSARVIWLLVRLPVPSAAPHPASMRPLGVVETAGMTAMTALCAASLLL